MRKKAIIAGLIVLSGLAVFIFVHMNGAVEKGILAVSGNIEVTEVNPGFKLPGRIISIHADEGQTVTAGDRLAVLENAEMKSHVLKNKAYLNERRARLAELNAGARPGELAQAKADLESVDAELEMARKEFERAEALFSNSAISARQMDAARKMFTVLAARHKRTLEALNLLREGPRKEVIDAAENRVLQAEAALAASQEALKDTEMHAPASGVVLRRNAEPGETVFAGMPVYTIADLNSPWVKVYIKEDKLGKIKLGQKAEVTTDSYPDKTYEGKVTYISSEAEFTPKNVQTQEERVKLVFGVKVSVRNEDRELRPGMPADVRIILNE